MDREGSLVKAAMLIIHKFDDGKHQYVVENVVKYKKASGSKAFASGDRLVEVNSLDLQNITPEELAQVLAEGNPKLTLHKANKMKGHTEQSSPAEDTLHPVSKESTLLTFSMEMRREEDFKGNEVWEEGEAREDIKLDFCKEENEENGEVGDLLIVSMMKTSISLVSGRGCDDGCPCRECHGTGCTLNDVVMVSESSTLVLVPRGSGSFRLEKMLNYNVEQVVSHLYLRGICSQRTLYASPNPEKITIYFYKSNSGSFRGLPVVLNISESNCFLRCCKREERVLLELETCEKQRLSQISKSDESTLAFVFYMKSDRSKQRTFESALHLGWFIHILNTDMVEMGNLDGEKEEHSFLFIIQK